MTRCQGITNRSKAKSQNARKRRPTPRFPAKSNPISRPLLLTSQAEPLSSRTTTQSELDKLIATLLVDGRTAGIYAISMRVLDLTSVPVRGFLALLVREIMRNGRQRSKWSAGLLIEAGLAAISLLGFALIALVLTEEPTILGHQVAEAASLFMFMPLVPPLKNLQEYHGELFFAWRRMDVRAFTAVLLTVMKAALTVIIFLTARDLRHMGLLFNLSFAVTYAASAAILFLTFYRTRPVAGLIGNVDRLDGAVTRQAAPQAARTQCDNRHGSDDPCGRERALSGSR